MHHSPSRFRRAFWAVLFAFAGLLAGGRVAAQTDIKWNFGSATAQAGPSSALPPDVTVSPVAQGNNSGATPLLTTTSASSGYAGASGQFNAGAAARIGSLTTGPGGSAYFEFSLTPDLGKQLVTSALRFGARSTATGPQAFAIFTSVDQFSTPVATGLLPNNSLWTPQSPTLPTLTGASGTPVVYRIYGYGGVGSPSAGTANWRIDDLTVTVLTIAASGTAPALTATTPVADATGVSLSSPITLSFNQPVSVSVDTFTLTGSISGVHTATVSGGPISFTLAPATPFTPGETVAVGVRGAGVIDQATGELTMAGDYSFTFTTLSAPPLRAIHEVQGPGATSPLVGQTVTVQGVVTASFQSTTLGLGGFYLQAAEADYDADPATSEGIYIFDNLSPHSLPVAPGDVVSVSGTVSEFGTAPVTLTELVGITSVAKLGTAPLPEPVAVVLPLASAESLEHLEGMRVVCPQTLTVTDNYDLGHFGEFTVSNGRLLQPTNVAAPGGPANLVAAANELNRLLVDDGVAQTYPDPTPFLHPSAGLGSSLRGGDTVAGLTGILSCNFGSYLVEPTTEPSVIAANPRTPQAPRGDGRLRVAIGNVLNFFNGNAGLGGFPTARGASTREEYLRQRAKIIQGLLGLNADIVGLTEVENDGYGPGSALVDLVQTLNAAEPVGRSYAWVDASGVDNGTDQIHVALIYRVESVVPVGFPAALSNAYFNGIARPPLAQTFRELATGEILTVCVNHLRAKGSAASGAASDGLSPNPNLDQNDGQGTNSYVRTREAQTLASWLASDPTRSHDPDFLIIGDLNAYAKENPIAALEQAGFVNLTEKFEGPGGYSYLFGGQYGHLDHALASATLEGQVVGAATWHVNADEPIYLDYNLEDKSPAQQAVNVDSPYRYSDHDPVVIDLNLRSAAPAVSFADWIKRWSLPEDQQSPTADPDADGASNLLEYKFGTRPDRADTSAFPVLQKVGDQVVFRYSVSPAATDGQLAVWQSSDLQHWEQVNEEPVLESSTAERNSYRVTLAAPLDRVFLKLTVTEEDQP